MARKRSDDDEADDTPKTPSDAYVGLLGICTAALIAAAALLFLDGNELEAGLPKPTDPAVKLTDTGLLKPAQPGAAN